MINGVKNQIFAARHGFKGFPVTIGGQPYRVDEGLRRWNFEQEEEVRACIEQNLNPGDTAVDVGANFGMHSLVMANSVGDKGRVIAFEPIPANLKLLRKNIALNGYQSNTEIRETALSDLVVARIEMSVDSQGVDPAASLMGDNTGDSENSTGEKISVANHSLDNQLYDLTPTSGCLIKIDVEGAELSVLRSGIEFLKRVRPQLLIEVHDYALPGFGETTESVYQFIRRHGYKIQALTDMNNHNGHYHHILATRK